MKTMFNDEGNEIIVGTAQEIRALYGSMRRAKCTNYVPLYSDTPKFNRHERYELEIDEDGFFTVSRSYVQEPVDKKALRRFIYQQMIERCDQLRGQGFELFHKASERSVAVNGTHVRWRAFIDKLETAYDIENELCLRFGDIDLWIKPTDDIMVI